jgi:polysaccharide export outer membrane protein
MRFPSPVHNFLLSGAVLVFSTCFFGSCVNTRKLTYMQGQFDTAQLSKIAFAEPVAQRGDMLSIIVYSDNPNATALFNQQQLGGTSGATPSAEGSSAPGGASGAGSPSTGGFLVDEQGNIEFQQLGRIHVEGLTRSQLKDTLESRLKQYLQNPYCTIRFVNYRFTLLGEVSHPGIFSFPGEHVNLLQALGVGGDLTFYGRRDNILVIRERGGKREWGRMDLTKPEVINSPFFTLEPNDVVYVEANRKKVAANDQTAIRTITIATSILSTLAILYTLFK